MATAREKAQVAMELLQESILETVRENPGIGNAEIARKLDIHTTSRKGTQNDRLSWAVLELLVKGKQIKQPKEREGYYPL